MLIDHDNLEGYADAATYDLRDQSDTGLAFYSSLARETGGPILELGCGTGRICIPIARLGFAVTGLDVVPGMLSEAQRKSIGLSVRWVEADARDFNIEERFRLIYLTGNAFQAFLTRADQEQLLRNVRIHLDDDGLFAFETRNPRWANRAILSRLGNEYSPTDVPGEGLFAYLEDSEKEQYRGAFRDAAGHEVREWLTQRYDHVTQILHWTSRQQWREGTMEKTKLTRTAVRFMFPRELEAMLHYNGFEIERQYDDWNLEPLSAESPSIIVVCRKRQ